MSEKLLEKAQIQICQQFAKHQSHNFKFSIKNYQRVIILVGKSGVGKSAYAHMLKDPKSIKAIRHPKISGKFIIEKKDQQQKEGQGRIGHDKTSQTKQPNFYNVLTKDNQKILIIDCPGFLDSGGTKIDLINSNIMTKLFESVKKIRIHLCIAADQITNSKCTQLKQSLIDFFSYFNKTKENLNRIYRATTLIITKVRSEQRNELMQNIKEHIKSLSKQSKQVCSLLDACLQNAKLIPQAKQIHQTFEQILATQILQSELKLQFYQIEYNQGFDLSLNNKQCINDFYAAREKVFIEACQTLHQSVKIVIQNNTQLNISTSKKIRTLMQKFNKEQNIYERCDRKIFTNENLAQTNNFKDYFQALKNNIQVVSKQNTLKLMNVAISEQHKDFVWPIFFYSIVQANKMFKAILNQFKAKKGEIKQKQKKPKKKNRKFSEQIKEYQSVKKQESQLFINLYMVTCMLSCILNYVMIYLPAQKTDFFFDFVYIIWRTLQEMQIISNKKADVSRKTQNAWEILLIEQVNLNHKLYQFILEYQIKEETSEKYLICFQDVLNMVPSQFKPYQILENTTKLQIMVSQIKSQPYNQKKLYDQIKIYQKRGDNLMNEGNINSNLNQLSNALQLFEKARQLLQKHYKQQSNFDRYKQIAEEIYHKMGQTCVNLKLFKLAIQYFRVFQDNYMIKNSYENLIKSSTDLDQKYKFSVEKSKFFARTLMFEKAISLVEQLYSKTHQMKDKNQARKRRTFLANLEKKFKDQMCKRQQNLKSQNTSNEKNIKQKYYEPNQIKIAKFFNQRMSQIQKVKHMHQQHEVSNVESEQNQGNQNIFNEKRTKIRHTENLFNHEQRENQLMIPIRQHEANKINLLNSEQAHITVTQQIKPRSIQ